MRFNYQARNKEGLAQVGVIEVGSKKEAISLLQEEGLYVTQLEALESKPFYARKIKFLTKARKKDIMMFCRQLAMMLKSGVGLVESLKSLSLQTEKSDFREQIIKMANDIEGGVYFSEALAKFPKTFNDFFINIIKSGEATGKLSETLSYLSEHLEREYTLVSKIKSGMTYPAFITAIFLGMGIFGTFFVLPSFKETFDSLDVELPMITQMVLGFGDFAQDWWFAMLLITVLSILFFWRYINTKEGKEVMGRLSLKLPLIGPVARNIQLAKFTENLSTLILAGLPITQALEIVGNATSNIVYRKIVLASQEGVRRGEAMSVILEKYSKHMPSLVIQMMRVGERTGKLDEALMNVANFYQGEINRRIDGLVDIIEPILIVILGGLVAGLMVSIIVPVYKGMSSFGF
ncbi:MAG: type II secretion system F family protein [Patescibacteria group bacterium]|nr:type II secretion system F family protein [Patescibacteria group bacterium]